MNWTPEKIEILRSKNGTLNAPQLAQLIGCSRTSIHNKMKELGIKYIATSRFWTPEKLEILKSGAGKISGPAIAKLVGCNGQSVRDKMYRLGLKANRRVSQGTWTPEQISYLRENAGKLSSTTMAPIIGKCNTVICIKIRELGLIGMPKTNHVTWTPEKLDKLKLLETGVKLDKLSRELGISRRTVSHKAREIGIQICKSVSWRPHEDELLRSLATTASAKEIATQMGRSVGAVSCRAARLNIPLRGRGTPEPKSRRRANQSKGPIVRTVEYHTEICPVHRCLVSNWQEHRERLGCNAIPPHLAAFYRTTEIRA